MSSNSVLATDYTQDFIDITVDVFSTMSGLDVNLREVKQINNSASTSNGVTACMDITGILGFSGGRRGAILVSLPKSVALAAVGGMLGMDFQEVDAEVRDGVGELVNMVAGGAKTRLQSKGVNFELSIPNTVVGRKHEITAPANSDRTRLNFGSDAGDFFIEVYLKAE